MSYTIPVYAGTSRGENEGARYMGKKRRVMMEMD
jgi:hypothetical protein